MAERPSLSPPRESSTQSDVRTRMDMASSRKLREEQDRSPGRGEGASEATTRSAVIVTFRARDQHSEWNPSLLLIGPALLSIISTFG